MKQAIATVFIVVLTFVAISPAAAQPQVDQGQKVFAAQKCIICHAIAGQGNKKGVLDGIGAKLSADDIRQWIVNAPEMAGKAKAERKPPMKVYGTLPKADIDALVAYLSSLKK